jgi:hypothetical protein
MSSYDVLRRLLSDRPIAFHPSLARAFGGINEALFFQQIAYWSDKGTDPEWIYKSQVELEAETCLSSYQQKQSRDRLKRLGVLEDDRRGVPARLYYRINWDATFRLLDTANLDAERDPRFQETANLDSQQPIDLSTGNSRSISESTQRVLPERLFEDSKGPSLAEKYDQARLAILPYAQDLARELNDQAPLTSTTTRLTNMYRDSGIDLDVFLDLLLKARAITQERTPAIRAQRVGQDVDGIGRKPKMAYWFTVLEDLIGQTHAATGTSD